MLGRTQHQRGDTLIEVLFAVTVFSMIVVGALSLMNQGTSASRRALETTIARQAIDGQAETLRFLHESYVAEYQSGSTYNMGDAATSPGEQYAAIIDNAKAFPKLTASVLNAEGAACPATAPSGSFVVDPTVARALIDTSAIERAQVYPELVYDNAGVLSGSRGLWIEAIRPTGTTGVTNAGVIDFHIRACWQALGATVPVTMGTIVRLYEPRG